MNRILRHKRIRKKIKGTSSRPRFSVFRSLKGLYVQLIDDDKGCTIAAANYKELKNKYKNKLEQSKLLGMLIAQKAQKKKITKVVFDRGGYKYHGRIKAMADGARETGLIF
ncbi:MAG: 50S ribosomal protein L18 [Candidatus Jacksonbacteria bacterium]